MGTFLLPKMKFASECQIISAVAGHPAVRQRYPVLSQAILSGASPQIRNRIQTRIRRAWRGIREEGKSDLQWRRIRKERRCSDEAGAAARNLRFVAIYSDSLKN